MCPEREVLVRQVQATLHPFERAGVGAGQSNAATGPRVCPPSADATRAVKEYRRPAADGERAHPDDVRPAVVLLTTMEYLRDGVLAGRGPDLRSFAFVLGRLRSVRQDVTYQNLQCETTRKVLAIGVRVYALAGWLFARDHDFEERMNQMQLKLCLQSLAAMCQVDTAGWRAGRHDAVVAADIVYFLSDITVHGRAQAALAAGAVGPHASWALAILQAYTAGNYVRFFRLVRTAPSWVYVALLDRHFPAVRETALGVMNAAYATKATKFPLAVVADMLALDGERDAMLLCAHHKLAIDEPGAAVLFRKGAFVAPELQSGARDQLHLPSASIMAASAKAGSFAVEPSRLLNPDHS